MSAEASSPPPGPRLMAEGENVVLDERGEKHSFIKVKASGKIKVGKLYLPMAPLVGAPYGAMFMASANGKSLERMESPIQDWDFASNVQETEKDNRSLLDANATNQKMGADEIEALKRSGKSGAEIIEQLISNSATFNNKTEFSQDKYKKKKAKKYIFWITVREPSARAVCQAYYDKGPDRVFNLRYDSLAVMLNQANVAAGARVLLFDNCVGVVTAGVLERLGGAGVACASHVDKPYGADALRNTNLDARHMGVLHSAGLASLLAAKAVAPSAPEGAAAGADASGAPSTSEPAVGGTQQAKGGGAGGPAQPHRPNRQLTMANAARELASLAHPGFTSCIIASPKVHPLSLLEHALPLLQPSSPFVVFSPWPQPLAEALAQLQSSRQAVMLQLSESWLRPHQVLPMRTHPAMTCSGTGGYILSGIKLASDDDCKAAKLAGAAAAAAKQDGGPAAKADGAAAQPDKGASAGKGAKRGRDAAEEGAEGAEATAEGAEAATTAAADAVVV
ncbi:hypothetical protein FOA52_013976 [Chlamydomonas sp. UWO 241]|nr:hypothetical protein FOA52_013976 [Chlamydomonas sp. UWO 241]